LSNYQNTPGPRMGVPELPQQKVLVLLFKWIYFKEKHTLARNLD
jgi:hypothetical protein